MKNINFNNLPDQSNVSHSQINRNQTKLPHCDLSQKMLNSFMILNLYSVFLPLSFQQS